MTVHSPAPPHLQSSPTECSVSELITLINDTLSDKIGSLAFHGEVSECKLAASGHLYLTISDGQSSIRATMWANLVRHTPFQVKTGLHVLCVGKASVYPKSGGLQMNLSRVELYGEGELQKKFLELKAKLEKEGLFDESRKRPIPRFPRALGVVTSKAGAVIHDIETKVRERFPSLDIVLYDARVQGPGSAEDIARGIARLNAEELVDVIIVARGGGSLEDLWSFNEEIVARAIFASRLPVISGVGHETDITLADYVADLRAPTPTAAAEYATPKRSDLLEALARHKKKLFDVDRWFRPYVQTLDELGERRMRAGVSLLARMQQKVSYATSLLKRLEPQQLLLLRQERVTRLNEKMSQALTQGLRYHHQSLISLSKRFAALHPDRVLERGFALVQRNGKLVHDGKDLHAQDEIEIRFAHSLAQAKVLSIKEKYRKRKDIWQEKQKQKTSA